MRDVSKDEFFAALFADPRDIMPSHRLPHETHWETRGRALWGVSKPGWKNPGDPASYALVGKGVTVERP